MAASATTTRRIIRTYVRSIGISPIRSGRSDCLTLSPFNTPRTVRTARTIEFFLCVFVLIANASTEIPQCDDYHDGKSRYVPPGGGHALSVTPLPCRSGACETRLI